MLASYIFSLDRLLIMNECTWSSLGSSVVCLLIEFIRLNQNVILFGRCGPCQFMVPILNEVSATLKDKIQVVKIDTEKYPSIANKYKIEALPTFILFKNGEPCDRFV